MHLSEAMRAELERRLARATIEQPDDPAFRDLPKGDLLWLLVIAGAGIVLTVFLQGA